MASGIGLILVLKVLATVAGTVYLVRVGMLFNGDRLKRKSQTEARTALLLNRYQARQIANKTEDAIGAPAEKTEE